MAPFRYATAQVIVHWLAAALIIFLLATGSLVLAELPNDAAKIGNFRIHMLLGGLAGLLVIARMVMRQRLPGPPPTPGEKISRLLQLTLNLVILLLVASGAALAWQSGAFEAVFGAGTLPSDFKQFTPRRIHGLASRLAMGLIAIHVAAALYHQWVVKDRLLARMGFSARG